MGFEVVGKAPATVAAGMDIGVMDREEGIDLVLDLELGRAILGKRIPKSRPEFEDLLLVESGLGEDDGHIIRREGIAVLIRDRHDAMLVTGTTGQAQSEEEQNPGMESNVGGWCQPRQGHRSFLLADGREPGRAVP